MIPDLGVVAVRLPSVTSNDTWLALSGVYYNPDQDVTIEFSAGTSINVHFGDQMG